MAVEVDRASITRDTEPLARAAVVLQDGTWVAAAIYVVMFLAYLWLQPGARSFGQWEDQLANSLPLALAASGGAFVVLTRGFDLSVVGVIALSNVLVATLSAPGPVGLAMSLAMVVALGMLVGAINGMFVAVLELPPIACTLATMIVTSGAALLVLDAPGGDVPSDVSDLLFSRIGLMPCSLLVLLLVAALWSILKRTDWGVALYAVGADEAAARLAGIRISWVKFFAYCVAGGFYGLAGFAICAISSSGDPNSGTSLLLPVFASIAIAGVSFAGGKGSVVGAMIGALVITLVQKFLFSLGVTSFYTGIGQGVLMILATLIGGSSGIFSKKTS